MNALASPPASGAACAAGTWRLAPGQAVTLRPSQSGVLWVVAGALWATTDGPHHGAGTARGDRLLCAGDRVTLDSGEKLVMEPVGRREAVRFAWDPLAPAGRRSGAALLRRIALLVPASALTAAMWFGAAAESGRHRADVAAAPVSFARYAQQARVAPPAPHVRPPAGSGPA